MKKKTTSASNTHTHDSYEPVDNHNSFTSNLEEMNRINWIWMERCDLNNKPKTAIYAISRHSSNKRRLKHRLYEQFIVQTKAPLICIKALVAKCLLRMCMNVYLYIYGIYAYYKRTQMYSIGEPSHPWRRLYEPHEAVVAFKTDHDVRTLDNELCRTFFVLFGFCCAPGSMCYASYILHKTKVDSGSSVASAFTRTHANLSQTYKTYCTYWICREQPVDKKNPANNHEQNRRTDEKPSKLAWHAHFSRSYIYACNEFWNGEWMEAKELYIFIPCIVRSFFFSLFLFVDGVYNILRAQLSRSREKMECWAKICHWKPSLVSGLVRHSD